MNRSFKSLKEFVKLVNWACFSSFSENPARTFDLALQVACPSSENEGEPSFLSFVMFAYASVCLLNLCFKLLFGDFPCCEYTLKWHERNPCLLRLT